MQTASRLPPASPPPPPHTPLTSKSAYLPHLPKHTCTRTHFCKNVGAKYTPTGTHTKHILSTRTHNFRHSHEAHTHTAHIKHTHTHTPTATQTKHILSTQTHTKTDIRTKTHTHTLVTYIHTFAETRFKPTH